MEKSRMCLAYRSLAGCKDRPIKTRPKVPRLKGPPEEAAISKPKKRRRRQQKSPSLSPTPSPSRTRSHRSITADFNDGEPEEAVLSRTPFPARRSRSPAQRSRSPPRLRVLRSQIYPVLVDLRNSASTSKPVAVKDEPEPNLLEKTPKIFPKEPVIEVAGGVQQKIYFVDPSIDANISPPRYHSLNILHPPPFHTISRTLVEAHRLGLDESLTSRGTNREIFKRFHVDIAADLAPDVLVIVRFAPNPILNSPAQSRRPNNLQISLNKRPVIELTVINHNQAKKPQFGAPVELPGEFIYAENELFVSWTVDTKTNPNEDYLLFVECAKRKSVDTVMEDILMKRIEIPMGVSRAFRAFSGGDDGIETNSSTIGLVCPLSRKRIELPVRGRDCGHLECFDARNYVDLNHHTKAKWTCPRCSDSVSLEDLVVDDFMADLLRFSSQNNVELLPGAKSIIVKEIVKACPVAISLSDSKNASQFVDLE